MNFRSALQIKTAIRAMQQVVIPAVDSANKMATEQAGLVVAMLELLERTLPLAYRYDCDELNRSIALAEELHGVSEGVPALQASSGRLAASATCAHGILDRALADPGELEMACRDIRAAISDFVTIASNEVPLPERRAIARLTINSSKEQLLRERVWVISQGWESEPEKLPAIETLI